MPPALFEFLEYPGADSSPVEDNNVDSIEASDASYRWVLLAN
jgi:hypothetical protein